MSKDLTISRRTLLQGLGVAVALPSLEAMMPPLSFGAEAATPAAPKRLAFLYVPNGVHMADWRPRTVGADFELPPTLEPLRPFRGDVNVLTGLTCDKARPNGDGPGDHARAMSAYLTGCQPVKTHGANIRVGVSADQVAAQRVGRATRLPSLEIGCESGGQAGNCDSGYSCAYSANLSWRSESTPNPKEVNPRLVFDRLFAGQSRDEAAAARARRERYNLSILDFVTEDARRLSDRVGANDRRRLDEYLTSVREIETRLARASQPDGPTTTAVRPTGVPSNFGEHIRLMTDLLVLAFQGDVTRIATFVYAIEGSNRSYRLINVSEGHHDLSHHQNDRAKQAKIAQINRFHVTQFAYLLERLRSVREGNSTLLDSCMIVYGSGNSDGNRHNHDDLPILLAGKGGGTITAGRHVRFPRETPVTNLYLSLLDRMGASVPRLGDSTGRLSSLS
jgi:uncharacterized protein DUF1552